MIDFEKLTEKEQNEIILNISSKLDKQEIFYWEGLVHLLKEKDKEIERLNNIIKNGINEELSKELNDILKCNQRQVNRIDKAIEYIEDTTLYDGSNMAKQDLLEILKGSDKE